MATKTNPTAEAAQAAPSEGEQGATKALAVINRAGLIQSRMALSRRAAGLAAKARASRREYDRAASGGSKDPELAAIAERYAALFELAESEAKLVAGRETLHDSVGAKPAAYGRVVDKRGVGQAGVVVRILHDGKAIATTKTDADGGYAFAATERPAGEVILEVGDKGALGRVPLTVDDTLLPARAMLFRVEAAGPARRKK